MHRKHHGETSSGDLPDLIYRIAVAGPRLMRGANEFAEIASMKVHELARRRTPPT